MAGGDKRRGPCSLCGAKTSCSWRRLPSAAGDVAGQTACNACFVSVARQADVDPGNMDEMLALRTSLREVHGTKRRRVARQLMRSRSASSGKQREEGSSPLQQSQQESGGECSQGIEDGRADVHSGSWQEEQEEEEQQQQDDRQQLPQPLLPLQQQEQPRQEEHRDQQPPPQQQPQQEQQPPQQRAPPQEQQHSPQTPAAQLQQALSAQLQQTPAPAVHHPQQPVSMLAAPPLPLWATHPGFNGGLQALPPAASAVASTLPVQQPSLLQQAHQGMGGSAMQAAHQAWLISRRLRGRHPELVGQLPALWLLPAGPGASVQLAGALLTTVQLPPPSLGLEMQHTLLSAGQLLQPVLRLVVYCFVTGRLLQCRDWLRQEECTLQLHPRHRVLAWDSRDGWQLLFPEAAAHTLQTLQFEDTVRRFGLAAVRTPGSLPCLAAPQPLPQPQALLPRTLTALPPPTLPPALPLLPACRPWQLPSACGAPTSDILASGLLLSWNDDLPLEDAARAVGVPLTDDDVRFLRQCRGECDKNGGGVGSTAVPSA